LNGFLRHTLAKGRRALGNSKSTILILTAKGAVAVVGIATGGSQNTEVTTRGVVRGAGAVSHPIDLVACGWRPTSTECPKARDGFSIQFAGTPRDKAIVCIELITETARPRVKPGETCHVGGRLRCHKPRRGQDENANKRCFQ